MTNPGVSRGHTHPAGVMRDYLPRGLSAEEESRPFSRGRRGCQVPLFRDLYQMAIRPELGSVSSVVNVSRMGSTVTSVKTKMSKGSLGLRAIIWG